MNFAKISSKLILCVLALLFWAIAAALGYIGATIFMSYDRYGDFIVYLHSIVPAVIIMGAALLMFLIGIIGVFGLFSENRCLLGLFFALLAALLALETAGVVLIMLHRQHVQKYVHEVFDDVMKTYGYDNNTKISKSFDYLQHKLRCCGKSNYTDWQRTWWYANAKDRWGNVPQSCCVNYQSLDYSNDILGYSGVVPHFCTATSPQPTSNDNYFVEGCYTKLKQIIYNRFIYIAGFIMLLVLVQFIGLISTCILMFRRHKRFQQQPPYVNIATNDDAQFNL